MCENAPSPKYSSIMIVLLMVQSITWNIHTSDGAYVGQASGFCEQTAFSKCMSASGKDVIESDVETDGLPGGSANITYQTENFSVSPQV